MIKGVNKKIIEINAPDSLYFEKAVLYVRPNVAILPEAISQREAQRILSALIPDKKPKNSHSRLKKAVCAAVVLTIIAALFLLLT